MATTARAIAVLLVDQCNTDASSNIILAFDCALLVPGTAPVGFQVNISVASADTSTTILTNITSAVVNAAASYGYTVARTAVMVETFTRGQ